MFFFKFNRRFPEITGEDNLTVLSYSGRVKSPEWRWQRRRADLRHFEISRHGPTIIYTRLPAGGTYYPICTFPASSECLIGMPFWTFAYGYPSSCPRAYCNPNKSVPTLRYTRRYGPIYTGPCPKALTECSPLDFRRSSIVKRFEFLKALCKFPIIIIIPPTTAMKSYTITDGPRKLSANTHLADRFRWRSNGSTFVTDNSNYIRRFFYNRPHCLSKQQIKPKSFESRRNHSVFTQGGRASCLRACFDAMLLPQSY